MEYNEAWKGQREWKERNHKTKQELRFSCKNLEGDEWANEERSVLPFSSFITLPSFIIIQQNGREGRGTKPENKNIMWEENWSETKGTHEPENKKIII